MTHQTETARELLHRHGLPEDIIDGALCLHAQELAALQRLRMDELDLTGQKARLVGRIVDLIDPTRTPSAVSAAVAPPTGRAALRDRINEALVDHLSRTADIRTSSSGELAFMPEVTDAEQHRIADAVLAVLPTTDRTAVLREAISAVRDGDLGPRDGTSRDYEDGWWNSRAAAEQRIRSLVDTSTQTVTVVSHRLPMSEQLAEEMNEGSSLIQQWAARAAAEPTAGARQDGAQP